jgi:hypothetical protein
MSNGNRALHEVMLPAMRLRWGPNPLYRRRERLHVPLAILIPVEVAVLGYLLATGSYFGGALYAAMCVLAFILAYTRADRP